LTEMKIISTKKNLDDYVKKMRIHYLNIVLLQIHTIPFY